MTTAATNAESIRFLLPLLHNGLGEHVLRRKLMLWIHLHMFDVGDETCLMGEHCLANRARPHLQVRAERCTRSSEACRGRRPWMCEQVLPQAALVDVVFAAHRTWMVRYSALHSHFFV